LDETTSSTTYPSLTYLSWREDSRIILLPVHVQ